MAKDKNGNSAQDNKAVLWAAADKLRDQMDAAEYKHLTLGLIFLKYISDSFSEHQVKVKEMVSNPASDFFISEDPAEYAQDLEDLSLIHISEPTRRPPM